MIPESDAWCVSCQRWEGERTSTHYDQQPKLNVGVIGVGEKFHLGYYPNKLYALCGSGAFEALSMKMNSNTEGLCKNCVREWRKRPEYRDF